MTLVDNLSGSVDFRISSVYALVKSGSTVLHEGTLGSVVTTPFNTEMLRYVGIGPQNLTETNAQFSSSLTASWTDIEIEVSASASTDYSKYYFKNGECLNYERTRFAFINKLGTWDYFNIAYPYEKKTQRDRSTTKQTHLQYQSITGDEPGLADPTLTTPIYDTKDRGLNNYYLQPTDTFSITSDWVTTEQADWLTELFDSPNVFVQTGSNFVPINITSAEYLWKTNKFNQKVFQYEFNYALSNERFNRT